MSKQRIVLLLTFFIAVTLLSQAHLVRAQNFLGPVTDGSDVVDTNDGVCTLREAMNAAFNNAQANDDCGTGSITDTDVITFSGVSMVTLDNSHTELPNIDDDNPNGVDLEIDGAGVTLDVYNIAFVVHDDAEFVLNGMTLINSGAASIQTTSMANVTLNNVDFNNNNATSGGAIFNSGTMVINGGTFNGNVATNDGGAIINSGDLTLNGVTFKNNSAGAHGGAIASSGNLTINATNPATTFDSNFSTTQDEFGGGGALFLDNNSVSTISGVSFTNNHTSDGRGGAIYGGNFGAATGSTISGSLFSGNYNNGLQGNSGTNGDGGAFWVQGAWTVTDSYFHTNTATTGSGGGLAVFSQGNLSLSNSTVSDNTAGESGSGISTQNSATTTLTNVTVAANTGAGTGQLYSSSATFNLRNTIIANPASGTNCSPSVGSFTDGGGNLQFPDSSCVSATTGDPKLVGNASGFALSVGSAATDIGDQTYCNSVTTDQVGSPRSQDGNGDGNAVCDAGSQEGGTNMKPTANDDSYNVDQGQTLDLPANGVLGNDTDPENAQLTAAQDSDVSNGQLTFNADGSFSYKPNSGFKGDDSFTYHANDGASDSNIVTVTITVKNVAPTAGDDNFNVSTSPYIFDTSNLLTNDSDPGGDTLSVTLSSNPTITDLGGTVTQVGPVLTYVPLVNGTDSFTYVASDGTANSNSATVTFNVTGIANTTPTIGDVQDQNIPQDTDTGALDFTVNDAETPLALLIVTGSSDNQTLVPDANVVIGGSLGSRTVTVTPAAGQFGKATITLMVSDGELMAADTFLLTVTSTGNTAPTINFALGNQTITEDTNTGALAFTVGDTETPNALTVTGSSNNQTLVPDANVVIGMVDATNRTVTVTPAAGQTGTATITITVSDGTLTNSASFLLTVNPPANTAPTINYAAGNPTINVNANTGALDFTVNDAETDPASLNVVGTSSNHTLVPDANIVFGGSGMNRTVTVTPLAGQSGVATITITVDDGSLSDSANFVLTVNAPGNTAPTITDVTDQNININSNTGALAFTIGDAETPNTLTVTGTSDNQTLVPDANVVLGTVDATHRTVTVTPLSGQTGQATITLTVSDGTATVTDTFVVNVTQPNTAPAIGDVTDKAITQDTSTGALDFTVNDAETPNSLTVTGSSNNQALVPDANVVIGGSGMNRTVTVTPLSGQTGQATITLTVSDGSLSAQDTFVLTVNAAVVNTAPTITYAAGDPTITQDTSTGALDFTVNDAETDPASLLVVKSSNNQTLVPDANIVLGGSSMNRTVTVTPASGQTGTATITLGVSDGTLTDTASFILTVNAAVVNTAPTIGDVTDQIIMVNTNTGALNFSINDAETPGSLTVTGSSNNQTLVPNVNVVIGGSGLSRNVTVTPASGQTGTATITITVSDGSLSASDTFLLTVNAPGNTAPTISDVGDQTNTQDTSTAALDFNINDAETPGSLTVTASSNNQTLVPDANIVLGGSGLNRTVTVTPASGQSGLATITLTVSDGTATATDTFVVTVNAPGAVDSDNDGLSDAYEQQIGTDLTNPDSDGDGYTDGQEVAANSDPLDNTSIPQPGQGNPPPQPPHYPTPTPVPLLTDFNGVNLSDVLLAQVPDSIRYGIFGRMLARNGAFVVGPQQVGNAGLIAQGVIHAADIYTAPGIDMSGGVGICFAGTGSLYFLDASTSPRQVNLLPTTVQNGYTCGVIYAPGMVVLTKAAPPPATDDSTQGTSLSNCSVTTEYLARLRADASLSAEVLTLVPYHTTLTASHRVTGWYQVDFNGTVGWISGQLLSVSMSCLG